MENFWEVFFTKKYLLGKSMQIENVFKKWISVSFVIHEVAENRELLTVVPGFTGDNVMH